MTEFRYATHCARCHVRVYEQIGDARCRAHPDAATYMRRMMPADLREKLVEQFGKGNRGN